MVGNWAKPTSSLEGGLSATYVTIEEHAAMKRHKEQAEKNKGKTSSDKSMTKEGKENKKDRSQLECWYCKVLK